MRCLLQIVCALALVVPGELYFSQLRDAARRILDGSTETWRRDQPESHSLTKNSKFLMSALSLVQNVDTIKMDHRKHLANYRVYDCGTGRTSLTMLNVLTGNFTQLQCLKNQSLSPDCTMCLDKSPGFLSSHHLVYDDAICQSENSPPESMPDHDTSLCSIGPLELQKCHHEVKRAEHVAWFWVDGKIRVYDDYSISWQEGKFLSLFDCRNKSSGAEACDKSACLEGHCTGDIQFCTEFSCSSESPVCACTRNKVPGVAVAHVKGGTFIPACFGKSMWLIGKKRSKRSVTRQQLCIDCETVCGDSEIHVVVRHFDPDHYQACLGSTCLTGVSNNREFSIPFKMADRMADSALQIHVWDKAKHNEYVITSECASIDACAAITCWFCRANWANVHCFSKEQTFILLIIISLCIIIVASVVRAIKVIAAFVWKILKPMFWLVSVLSRAATRVARLRVNRIKDSVHSLEEGLVEIPLVEIPREPARANPAVANRMRMFQLSRLTILSLVLIVVPQGVELCSDSLSVTASSSRCVTDRFGHTKCSLSTSSLLQVSPKGQESCIILKNPNNQAIETIRIQTEDIKLECVRRDLYWVPRATHRCVGTRRCHLMGECQGEKCSEFKIDSYSPEWGHEEELMSKLGWSYCIEQCGGALCQCFNMNPSCFYLRKTFNLITQDAYNMFECSEWSYKINVLVHTNSTTTKVALKLGVPDSIPNGVISLSTVSQPPAVAYTECFGEDLHGSKFHAVCNRRTDFTLGRLGEIQCPTKADALSISKRCISTDSIVFSKVHKDAVDCRSSIIDPSLILSKNKLPSTVGSVTFWPSESSVVASVPELASATMMIRLDGYTIEYRSDNSKCNARFLKLNGCYNCEPGAKLEIEHVTDFGTAMGILECPEAGYTTYYQVTPSLVKDVRTIHLNNSHINLACAFKCPNSQQDIQIKGELVYLFNDDVRHSNQTLTPGLAPKTGTSWDPFGWLRFSWMRLIWSLFGSTIAIIIGIIAAYLIWTRCIKSKKQ
nr:glycoprotein precursor [Catch-me-cave virus]